MSSKDYKKLILDGLLKKYNRRQIKNTNTNRRIILKPTEVYRDYTKNNADINEKQRCHDAIKELLDMGVIAVDHLKFSEDIEKIYLCEEQLDTIYGYLRDAYGIIPQSTLSKQVKEIVKSYEGTGEVVKKYCESVLAQIEEPGINIDPQRIEANMKMLGFLERNEENLYIREASMLVYGDSKWFENHNYDEICTFLRTADERPCGESERNDEILGYYHIVPTEQEIFLKGAWQIQWDQLLLDTSRLRGGIAIATNDVQSIRKITVNAENLMTIENKTSYQRLGNNDMALMYLGGFANRHQIQFLKKVIQDNPDINCLHFGDIDIGGFLIHKHLCRETSKNFALYCMGVEQLQDQRYQSCLRPLTDRDLTRLAALVDDPAYSEVLTYMKEHQVKLEQEIVSYYL